MKYYIPVVPAICWRVEIEIIAESNEATGRLLGRLTDKLIEEIEPVTVTVWIGDGTHSLKLEHREADWESVLEKTEKLLQEYGLIRGTEEELTTKAS